MPTFVHSPEAFAELFATAETRLAEWLAQRVFKPEQATIAVGGERYLEVRANSLSVEFFDLVRNHYGGDRAPEADRVARALLFDIANALARVDAARLAEQVGATEPEAILALGPAHFALTGWARVVIHEGSRPEATDDYVLLYDHENSFEAAAWLERGRRPEQPVCVMNAGYSAGWCSQALGLELVATEILCRGRGDPCCRFVMAPPHRIHGHVEAARARWPEVADRMVAPRPTGFAPPTTPPADSWFDQGARVRIAFEHAQIATAIVSTEGRYLLCNAAFGRLFKRDAEALVGAYVGHTSDALKGHADDVFASLLSGERDQFEQELTTVDAEGGRVHLHAVGSLVRDETGRGLFFVLQLQDLTAQREAQEQLRRAQKLQVAQELAGGLAHDLNNLLTVILGAADQLEGLLPPEHGGAGAVDAIQRAASRAGAVTQQLLSFSRRQVVEARVHDLRGIVEDIAVILERVLGERIVLDLDLQADVPPVRIDAGQLEQVLVNLTVNARHAMPSGGHLRITLRRDGDDAVLDVTDDGDGMPPEIVRRVTEPFFTTRPEGTGLGLAVVHGIIEQAGGTLRFDSVEHEGTHVQVRLPGVTERPTPKRATPRRRTRGHEVILLAEDDDEIRHMLTEALEALGYAVLAASDGEEAVAIAHEAPPIDLLLTDVVMPGLAGPEVASYVAQRHPRMRVLFMSGYADADLEHHALPHDARVVRKPFTLKAMATRVREILDS